MCCQINKINESKYIIIIIHLFGPKLDIQCHIVVNKNACFKKAFCSMNLCFLLSFLKTKFVCVLQV